METEKLPKAADSPLLEIYFYINLFFEDFHFIVKIRKDLWVIFFMKRR